MPKKVNHAVRRQAFCDAALRLIKSQGFHAATARAVAKEAGFTTGALQHYTEHLDDLLVQASAALLAELGPQADAAALGTSPVEALRQIMYLWLCTDAEQRGKWNFFFGCLERSTRSAAVRELTHGAYDDWLRRVERLIQDAKKRREIAPDVSVRQAARACVALVDGIATMVAYSGKPFPGRSQKELVDLWIASWLRPRERPGRPSTPAI